MYLEKKRFSDSGVSQALSNANTIKSQGVRIVTVSAGGSYNLSALSTNSTIGNYDLSIPDIINPSTAFDAILQALR